MVPEKKPGKSLVKKCGKPLKTLFWDTLYRSSGCFDIRDLFREGVLTVLSVLVIGLGPKSATFSHFSVFFGHFSVPNSSIDG